MQISFTPSSARYESYRILLRHTGEIGIDILLSMTGYLVFMVLEVFLPCPPEPGKGGINERFEYIKLIRLRLDQHPDQPDTVSVGPANIVARESVDSLLPSSDSNTRSVPSDARQHGLMPKSVFELSGFSRFWSDSSILPPKPPVSEYPNEQSSLMPREHARTKNEWISPYTVPLIDLDSGRAYLQVIPPAARATSISDQMSITSTSSAPTSEILLTPTMTWRTLSPIEEDIVTETAPSTYGSLETTSNLGSTHAGVGAPQSSRPGTIVLPTLFHYGNLTRNHLVYTILVMVAIWAAVLSIPLPDHLSLSAPLAQHTPLPVACIIPPVHPIMDDLVYLSQTVSGRVKLIVWPEDALMVQDEMEAEEAIDQVRSLI
jgi:hypothetical protein